MRRSTALFIFGLVFWLALPFIVKSQDCQPTKRTYANYQASYLDGLGLLGSPTLVSSINNPANAVDGNPQTNSTLNIPLGALGLTSATQFLEFTTTGTHASKRSIAANTPVTVKISVPKELLGALTSLEIGSYSDLNPISEAWPWLAGVGHYAGYTANSPAQYLTSVNLVNLISGTGDIELTFTPTQNFSGVYIKLTASALSLATSMKVFGAYINESTTTVPDCNQFVDVLSGIEPLTPLGSIATGLGNSVTDPYYAIDGNLGTYAQLSSTVQALSDVFETAIFSQSSQPGDSVAIVLKDPGGTLLSLIALTNLQIQPYLGNATAGPALTSSTFLSLKLLSVGSDKYVLTLPVNQAFDRIKISVGGIAGVLSSLNIYDIKRVMRRPTTTIDGLTSDTQHICAGKTSPTLAVSNTQTCTDYKWYDAATNGNLLYTGVPYTPGTLTEGSHTFYVEASRGNCTTSSTRAPVTLVVDPLPTVTLSNTSTCAGSPILLQVQDKNADYIYKWYDASVGGNLLSTSFKYATPPLTADQTYYVEVTNNLTGCSATTRTSLTVTVKPQALIGTINGPSELCNNQTATFTNNVPNGLWTIGDPSLASIDLHTGKLTPVPLSEGYVEVKYTIPGTTTTCSSNISVFLEIKPLPTLTISTPTEICSGSPTVVLDYADVSNNPTLYSIIWDTSATTAGLNNISDQTFPTGGQIPINIPQNIMPGTYNGALILKNATSCDNSIPFSIKINQRLSTPQVNIITTSQY